MELSYEQLFNRLSEKTMDNTTQLRRGVAQRRNGMEDLYGTVYTVNGDNGHPATFYVSVSPDLVYYERFAFKFVIQPFVSTVGEGTSSVQVAVLDESLEIQQLGDNNIIVPNPHNHSTLPHTHNMVSGSSFVPTTSTYWRVRIHGVDITAYLAEQHDGDWIDGEGIFPNNSLAKNGFYDILDVACMLKAEGRTADLEKLLAPEFKKVEIISDAPFSVTAFLYLKYSHSNR